MKYNLQAMRKKAGFKSARAFAEHIGMSLNTYNNYEQGRNSLTLEKAWEFADILHCTLDELAGRDFRPPGEVVSDPYERELIGLYRAVDGKAKGHILDDARGQRELSLKTPERAEDVSEVSEACA